MTIEDHYEPIIDALVSTTVSHIDGVAEMSVDSGATFTGKLFRSTSNSIQVTLLPNNLVTVDISVKAYHGVRVPDLAYTIQTAVKSAVESSTPYHTQSINVNVVGVVFR